MNPELKKLEEAVSTLTAEGQPFAVERVEIDGVEYQNYSAMPANLGQYFMLMQQHADKEFAVYLEERYTYGEAYALGAPSAGRCWSAMICARVTGWPSSAGIIPSG